MANITISGLTGKTAVATDEIEVQATAAGASNKVTLASAFAANNGATLGANTFTALQTITQATANLGALAVSGVSSYANPAIVSVNGATIPTALRTFHNGGVTTPFDVVVGPQSGANWSGISVLGQGDGAIANVGTTTTHPYLEFSKSGGTLASPTNIAADWLLGEIAVIGYPAGAYEVSTLIDFVTKTGNNRSGQINYILSNGGTFNQAVPNYFFNATAMYANVASATFGTSSTVHSLTNGIQVSNTNATSNFNMVRGNAANYAYLGMTPEVALATNNPHWGAGLYANVYDWYLWTYNGTTNTPRLVVTTGGNVGIGQTTVTAALHLKAGTATASTAPLKFASGTNLTTAEAGAMEYNGTNLFFTRSGTTRENVLVAATVNSVSPTSPNRTLTVNIGGTDYYIAAKTTND